MSNLVRVGLTETRNAYGGMPERMEDLPGLADKMEEIRAANLDHHAELAAAAADQGVQILGFGELFPGPYFAITPDPIWHALAEDARRGPSILRCQELAGAHGMAVVAPIYELDGERRFNTAVVLDADGTWLGRYRKTHIPSGRNELAGFCEDFYYDRSDGDGGFFPVFTTRFARIGVSTCYDRHFEGVVRSLATAGAQIVFSPAVTFGEQSQRMWPLEFAVDAMRHRVFIAGSNRRGGERPWNIPFFGESHVVGPAGRRPNLSERDRLIVADLDLDELTAASSSGWDLARDTRDDATRP